MALVAGPIHAQNLALMALQDASLFDRYIGERFDFLSDLMD